MSQLSVGSSGSGTCTYPRAVKCMGPGLPANKGFSFSFSSANADTQARCSKELSATASQILGNTLSHASDE